MSVLALSRGPSHRAAALSFSRVFDRLFDDSFDRHLGGSDNASRTPALDVSETDTHYIVALEAPGVSRDQLKVSVEGRRVSIETVAVSKDDEASTEKADASPKNAARVLYRERGAARYARTVSLPAEVDQTASQAKFENGVLTLTLAKKTPAGATRISVA